METPIHLFRPNLNTEKILAELRPVIDSGWIGLGPKTEEFERKFAAYVGAEFAVGLNSCTSALHLALAAYDIGKGARVATTPITFASTNEAILYQGAEPVWIDVDKDMQMDFALLKKRAEKGGLDAVIAVHYGGTPHPYLEDIYQLSENYGFLVIEDAAHAAGATKSNDMRIGTCAGTSIACFSFHAVKNLPMGDGGAITTNDVRAYEKLKRLRWLGINRDTYTRTEKANNKGYNWEYDISTVGYKYHMNDLMATIGLVQLKTLNAGNVYRGMLLREYRKHLDQSIDIVGGTKGSSNHLVVIKINANKRDELISYLNSKNIFPGVHYYPNHLYPIFEKFRRPLPVAEQEWKRLISLPCHLSLSQDDVKRVSTEINNFLTGRTS